MRSINLQSFLLIPLMVSELCPRQSSKCKNEHGAITTKFGNAEFKFLYTAHVPIEIYLPTKFHVDISCSFTVIFVQDFFKKGDTSFIGQNKVCFCTAL
jgi:hypothetical protein